MAALGRSDITSEMQVKLPTNNVKFITALLLREFEEIMNESFFNLVDDTLANINTSNGTSVESELVEIRKNSLNPFFYILLNIDVSGSTFTITGHSSNLSGVTVTYNDNGSTTTQALMTYPVGYGESLTMSPHASFQGVSQNPTSGGVTITQQIGDLITSAGGVYSTSIRFKFYRTTGNIVYIADL